MGKLSRKFRIGEKIGVGFGIVGLLFVGVIWQYHSTLQQALADYRQLHDVYGARKAQALAVENNMLRAQRAEKNFLLSHKESYAEQTLVSLQQALGAAVALEQSGEGDADGGRMLSDLIHDYEQRFKGELAAWRTMGLDHNSGLQGAFRDSVHRLEEMAGQLKVDRLYLLLLQIRRSEKDLGLRREQQYRQRVEDLIDAFSQEIAAAGLEEALQASLFHEIEVYREAFKPYADKLLQDPRPDTGKGPFRQAAHRIEKLLESHQLSGLGESVLQVRRREKDYLLRRDRQYVSMTIDELDRIVAQVAASSLSQQDKQRFNVLIDNYRRDFLALVEQYERIGSLSQQMAEAVNEILSQVADNVTNADQAMSAMRHSIDESTAGDERAMLWVVILAAALGIFFTIAITLPIVRPLRRMADLLDRLASEEPVERIHFYPGGRDEVNAMAGSVNDIADHKSGFIAWWEASMREADACVRAEELIAQSATAEDSDQANDELRQAVLARKELRWKQYNKMHGLVERIIDSAEQLLAHARPGNAEIALNTIRYSARSVQTTLEMASTPESRKRGPV